MTQQNDALVPVTLKPCPSPWCHRSDSLPPVLIWVGTEAAVECSSCGMRGPSISPVVYDENGDFKGTIDAEAQAIAVWNTRAHSPAAIAGSAAMDALTAGDADLIGGGE